MTILAIDTCETHCSAALVTSTGAAFACSEDLGRGHAERLMPMIEELLEKADVSYGDLQKIAVATGPGTFTGLRIGLSVARGLSLSLEIPCVGVSSLVALAAQAPSGGPVHAVIKGRGGQVYYQGFEGVEQNGLPKPISAPVNCDAEDAHHAIEARSGYVLGSGVPRVMGWETDGGDAIDPLALAHAARSLDPVDFTPEPYYLRAADAIKAKPILKVSEK